MTETMKDSIDNSHESKASIDRCNTSIVEDDCPHWDYLPFNDDDVRHWGTPEATVREPDISN